MSFNSSYVDTLVPSDRPFTRRITDCNQISSDDLNAGCPLDKLVNLDESIKSALRVIEEEAPKEMNTSLGAYRCTPVVYPRLARGGKSTFLKVLYKALKDDGRFVPIFISFNGDFVRRKGEFARDSITREIAIQLIDTGSGLYKSSIVCDNEKLLEHIENTRDGKMVVLLIDELNQLGVPLDEEASSFLKKHFLDASNRALVFTSHMALDLDYFAKGGSIRDHKIVPLPVSNDIMKLRQMGAHCQALTELEAAMYGDIPSLIYSLKSDGTTFYSRVTMADIIFPRKGKHEVYYKILEAFVDQLLDGEIEPLTEANKEWISVVRQFDIFASVPETRKVLFPIGFIAAILDGFKFLKSPIRPWLESLQTYASTVGSGKDWELITQFAVLLHCIKTCIDTNYSSYCVVDFLGENKRDLCKWSKIRTKNLEHSWRNKNTRETKNLVR